VAGKIKDKKVINLSTVSTTTTNYINPILIVFWCGKEWEKVSKTLL
jgi:hypothetical protein